MVERIKLLEKQASSLEPDEGQRRVQSEKVFAYVDFLLKKFDHQKAYVADSCEKDIFFSTPFGEEPEQIDAVIDFIKEKVDNSGIHLGAKGHLAYIPAGGLFLAGLSNYIAALSGRYTGLFFASPGAVRLERSIIQWIASVVGYPDGFAGDLTSGGSISNLVAIVTARESYDLKAKDYSNAVVYLTEQTHHTAEKALRIAGMRDCIKRYIPLDDSFRMRTDMLEKNIVVDKGQRLRPWLIIATAGTTDTGAVDLMEPISAIAQKYDIWFHVDGAYGALFALCEIGKKILSGMNSSDSIIVNPHKGLFMPPGTGVVLVRKGQTMYNAHHSTGPYLQDEHDLDTNNEMSPADLSLELTRPFRGLRLWMALKLIGIAPFRAALEEKILLARYFYEKLKMLPGFKVGPYPDLSIVIFRYIPARGDVNDFNKNLIQEINKDGRIFLSSTLIAGNFTLRMAILGFRTHLETIDLAINILNEKAKKLVETH